ncbi:MAG: hypothetical protein NTZ16_04600 [Verrucomicrobia bacterium]|nr:hypothetical protein [Verrucomicrobiota bacterium]
MAEVISFWYSSGGLLVILDEVLVLLVHLGGAFLERGVGFLGFPIVVEHFFQVDDGGLGLGQSRRPGNRQEQQCGNEVTDQFFHN